ncbi:undecaprenyl-phosphate glucose phosphotransferase [Flavihumibacter rivuli]|uniref:undecaprenyl-phosphate glucose phosphotransferase n=1 Tax=Flavihumibacter rivuli TaxID=2838156 RepID=UPI001BDF1C44|nr:undecaprenyl-phosphate glucose phosphotransferase [Flavihumibacter rivuli]ULQ57944.1 undecaprenyl-phosphate glucose phosphotransferase [Flavihumibacter rivuli]
MYKLSFTLYRNLLWLWDIICLNLAMLLVGVFVLKNDELYQLEYHLLIAVANITWLAAVYLTALYLQKNWLDFSTFLKLTIKSLLLMVLALMVFLFLYRYPYSRFYVVVSMAAFGALLLVNRLVLEVLVFSLKRQFSFEKKVVVLGYNDISRRLVKYFEDEAKLVNFMGCFEAGEKIDHHDEVRILGGLDDCMKFVKENHVSEIYCTLAPESYPKLYDLAKEAEMNFIYFKVVPDYRIFVNRNFSVDFVNDIPVLSLRRQPLEDTGNRIKKRVFDIVFSFFVIVFILSWLIPLIAILIKLDSKGPVFFLQMRSGKNNQPFRCIKFRTLKVNDEANIKQVTRGDSRITRLGRFMRKANIDELPQFFNVFLGDMSVVGPRPHMLKHTEDFSNLYTDYMIRHFAKPGITGWAQAHGFRGEITDNELLRKRVEHDLWYIENWTIGLDIKIIFLTILVSIKGDKNAF